MNEATQTNLDAVKQRIFELDLAPIKVKIMDPEEGEGWSREHAERVETQYKRFLFLTAKYQQAIVPSTTVDAMWHQHILDTRKYAEDCDQTFGYFLHHFPYFGMRGPDDAVALDDAFAKTCSLYESEFGESYLAGLEKGVKCNSCGAANCGGAGCVGDGGKCSGDSGKGFTKEFQLRPTLEPFAVQ